MGTRDHDPKRRQFLRLTLLGAAAVPASALLLRQPAWAQERVEESGATAQALGYRHDASQVTHDAYQEGQNCANCQLYNASVGGEGWGACAAFGGNLVNANGWCTAYVAKA